MDFSLWWGSLFYAGLRIAVALVLIGWSIRSVGPGWPVAGQAASDAGSAVLLLAYVSTGLREGLDLLAVPLAGFVTAWEAVAVVRDFRPIHQEAAGDEAALPGGAFPMLLGFWWWGWKLLGVVPPVVAGGFLVFNVVAPGRWTFPREVPRPGLVCEPPTLARGDTLTLRLVRPHGGLLSAAVPGGRWVQVVYAPPDAPPPQLPSERFRRMKRLRLVADTGRPGIDGFAPLDPVFGDTGVYTFLVEDIGALPTLVCRVRYAG